MRVSLCPYIGHPKLMVTTRSLTSRWTKCNIAHSALLMEFDDELDATGLLCPLPVLKAAKRLKSMPSGSVLKIHTDDPAAVVDVPHFCDEQGHTLMSENDSGGRQVYFIRRR